MIKKMVWLMPRIQRAVPYLGYIAISGVKPIDGKDSEVPREKSTDD